jgi:hypothetical protein
MLYSCVGKHQRNKQQWASTLPTRAWSYQEELGMHLRPSKNKHSTAGMRNIQDDGEFWKSDINQ